MHGPKLANGLIALGRGPTGGIELGHHNAGGTYLARIEKKGTAVMFSVDVDWNGKDFKPSFTHTFDDIRKYAGKLDD